MDNTNETRTEYLDRVRWLIKESMIRIEEIAPEELIRINLGCYFREWNEVASEVFGNPPRLDPGPEGSEILQKYFNALKERNFVQMSNVAGELLQLTNPNWMLDRSGLCPGCYTRCPRVFIGKELWFSCYRCGFKWFAGSDVHSGWQELTEEQSAQNAQRLSEYEEVHPIFILERIAPTEEVPL